MRIKTADYVGYRLAPFFRIFETDASCVIVSHSKVTTGYMKKNKTHKTKSTSNSKDETKDNVLLNRIIKTREEILDLLRVLKTF